ncbi:MAG: hypothetical protein EOO38_31985 [Cytophagaceae bacterium]|nr:MAG: hypothetical protein EOO38_31985 [Cytophagaceae bacterium]
MAEVFQESRHFLKQLRGAYGERRVVLVWDNWTVHWHETVLRFASKQRIELLWLPTYSPRLNLIKKL